MSVQLSASLPGVFQNTLRSGLTGGNTNTSSISNLGGLVGGSSSAASVGQNPLNPLQGASALRGLNGFVSNLVQTNNLRKAGALPGGTTGAAAGGGGSEQQLMSTLMTLFSMLQSALASQQGGASPAPAAQAAAAPAPTPAPAQANPFAGATSNILGGNSGSAASSLLSGVIPGSGTPSPGGGLGSVFSRIGDNFASIDTAINKVLGGISSSLPIARL